MSQAIDLLLIVRNKWRLTDDPLEQTFEIAIEQRLKIGCRNTSDCYWKSTWGASRRAAMLGRRRAAGGSRRHGFARSRRQRFCLPRNNLTLQFHEIQGPLFNQIDENR